MRKHGTFRFILVDMNDSIIESWEALKLFSSSITKGSLIKTHPLPLFQNYQDKNNQAFLAAAQTSKGYILEEIEVIVKAIIYPKYI